MMTSSAAATPAPSGRRKAPPDDPKHALALYFLMWYAGNILYNHLNTAAVNEVGKEAGLTLTIATMQLGACVCWSLLIWLVGRNPIKLLGLQPPARQTMPRITSTLLATSAPLGLCSAVAHNTSVMALGADPLFGQIVKSGEPTFAAIVNTIFYDRPPSKLRAACLPIIVGGVAFASMTPAASGHVGPRVLGYSLSFSAAAMAFGIVANVASAFKGGENAKLSSDDDNVDAAAKGTTHAQRMGGLGNQFALTQAISFFASLPLAWLLEGREWGLFVATASRSPTFATNVFFSGIAFYIYDELATMTVKAAGPVTSSVANTAKRVVVMVYMAAYTGIPLTTEQKQGAAVAFVGVFLYSVVDDVLGAGVAVHVAAAKPKPKRD